MTRSAVALLFVVLTPLLAAEAQERDTVTRDTLRRVKLEPVRVTVTRTTTNVRGQPFAISVVGLEAAGARPAIDLNELLLTVPGLFAANRQNPSQDVRLSIRGFGTRSPFGVRGIRILLDGIPQTLPDGQGQLTNVDPGELERLEIIRGTASVLHGNASGGVISLHSRVGGANVRPLEAGVVAGAFGTVKTRASSGVGWGDGGVTVNAAYTRSDGYREHGARRRMHGAIAVRQEFGAAVLTTHVRVTRDPTAQNPGGLTQVQVDSMPNMADPRNVTANAGKAVTQAIAGASLRGRIGQASYDVAVFGLQRDLDNPLSFATIALSRWAWGTRASTSLPFPGLPALPLVTVGMDAQWQRDDRLNLSPDGTATTLSQLERVNELGPFVQLALFPLAAVTVTGGVRYDRITFTAADRLLEDGDQSGSRVMASFSGAVGVAVEVAPWLAPYANVSTSFETPTTTELVNRPDGSGGFNPDLEPQHATSVEVGVRGAWRRGSYELAYFDTRVRGELIPFEVLGGSGRQFFRNAGSALHRGLEASASLVSRWGTSATVAYTLADYRFRGFRVDGDVFDGNLLPGVPRHRVFGSVRQPVGPGWVALDVTGTSRLYADDANQAPVEGWVTVAVRGAVSTRWRGVRVEPYAMLANIFDRAYIGSVVVNAFGGRFFEPAPGRALTVGLGLRWERQ